MSGHAILRRILALYEQVLGDLEHAEDPPPIDTLVDVTLTLQGYVQGYLETIEETYVFPRIERALPLTVATLRRQHSEAAQLTTDALVALRQRDLKRLYHALDTLILLYEVHTSWEDTDVMIAFRRTYGAREGLRLSKLFDRIESSVLGPHAEEQVLAQVKSAEEQLGILGPAFA